MFLSCNQGTNNIKSHNIDKNIAFGIDVSEYQGEINWEKVTDQKKHPIEFVFIRSTMGKNRKDKKFQKNWRSAKEKGFIVGAYHYYDPNENSVAQAENYLKSTPLKSGDFIPVVDIESLGKKQSKERLLLGLKRWLDIVEKHYGVKPIIYTGHSFFKSHLLDYFAEYPLWIAAYSNKKRVDRLVVDAEIHQFSEKVRVPGINSNTVDGNDISREKLKDLVLK